MLRLHDFRESGNGYKVRLLLAQLGQKYDWTEVDIDRGETRKPEFLQRNPNGGIHHLCYEVDDIVAARDRLIAEGARVLGQGDPKIGAHGKPVLFLHPKDFCGTLVEIEQA